MSPQKPHCAATLRARLHWPLVATLLLVAASACGADRPQDPGETTAQPSEASRAQQPAPSAAAAALPRPGDDGKARPAKPGDSPFAIVLDDGRLRVLDTSGRAIPAEEADLPVDAEQIQSVESLTIIRVKGSCYHLICYRGKCYKLPC